MKRTKEAYKEYLKSSFWRKLRKEAIKLQPTCIHCGTSKFLHVHHWKYPKVWGTEDISYLQVLCRHCHKKVHTRKAVKPSKKKLKHSKELRKKQKELSYRVRMSGEVKVFSKEEIEKYKQNNTLG